jgi:hypothetical protein
MARPKGTKYIETPEKMWELFEGYKKEVKDNPRVIYDFVGRDGNEVAKRLERPLTMEGFECYCYDKGVTVSNYFENKHDAYEDYYGICTRIRKEIREDQITGGMVGQYNASITQRLNNLKEQTENQTTITEVPLFPDVQEDDSDK